MIHEAASKGYRAKADTYALARPKYQPEMVARIVERYAFGEVVDLAAGTGIFTEQLVEAGCWPIAIEPVVEMRAVLGHRLPTIDARPGTAEAMCLDEAAADCITAAQAFHWFDHQRALDEVARVLRPSGHLITVWNVRDTNVPWMREFTELMDRYAGPTPRHRTMLWRSALESSPRFELVEEQSAANLQSTDTRGVADRALSTSFIAALGPKEQERVVATVEAITATLGKTFDFPYRSEFQAWRLIEAR